MLRFSTLTIFALAASFVAAQSSSSASASEIESESSSAAPAPTGGPSECIVTCSTAAATAAGCSSYTDFTCVCTSQAFQTSAGQCISTTCPDQLAAATALQEAACAGVTPPIVSSGAASGTPSGTVSGTPSAGTSAPGTSAPGTGTSRPATSVSGTSSASKATASTSSSAPAATTGAAFKNAPVAGAMGALAALVGAAIF